MHESSLGGTLRDYLSGQEIDETTFEEFRQALARFLVEEKGYPRQRIRAKVPLTYCVDGEQHERPLDFVVSDDKGVPILVIIFCSGEVGTYERETVCAGRLIEGGPAPYALVTDTMDASLLDVAGGEVVARGMDAVPNWERLQAMAHSAPLARLSPEQREKQTRILHAYCGFLYGSCCGESCAAPTDKKG